MTEDTVMLMMLISGFISIVLIVLVLVFFKNSYFDDMKKSFEYPLYDSPNDLQDAILREKQEKERLNQENKKEEKKGYKEKNSL